MILVDSSVWIAVLRKEDTPQVRALFAFRDQSQVCVPDVVLLEVLQGARTDEHAAGIERRLRMYTIVPAMSPQIATEAARHYRMLRSQGITIRKTADLMIATCCLVGRHQLLHNDRDFDPFVRHLGLKTL